MNRIGLVMTIVGALWLACAAQGQSSSLYVQPAPAVGSGMVTGSYQPAFSGTGAAIPGGMADRGQPNLLSPAVAQVSFTSIAAPEPRYFQLHDLVTIIISESSQADSTAKLDTSKESNVEGELSQLPGFDLSKLLDLKFTQAVGENGQTSPKVALEFKNDFKGDGKYSRKDSFTARITAEVVDVKPNGNIVLEARKFIQTDKETQEIVLTGTCRAEDVRTDNTVLSTQLFDLRLVKNSTGELKKTSKKGWLTKAFESIFNF
ncbi:MAG: flagellar basal body L-ring protein FlgH [Phycisphaeraceae bacterium]|nr:flagellar basal body L-ring protein FlgH [Phycisphaeraceae bacterium]